MLKKWVKWIEVESTNVLKFSYRNGKLFVVYNTTPKEVFVYSNVPEAVYNKLLKAKSVGSFLNTEVKAKYKLATKLVNQ